MRGGGGSGPPRSAWQTQPDPAAGRSVPQTEPAGPGRPGHSGDGRRTVAHRDRLSLHPAARAGPATGSPG